MCYYFSNKNKPKNLSSLILLPFILLISSCSKNETEVSPAADKPVNGAKTTKALAERVFKLIQKNDFLEYRYLVINLNDITYVSKATLTYISKTQKSKETVNNAKLRLEKQIKNFPQRRITNLGHIKKAFARTREKITKAGVDWQSLQLSGIHKENRRSRYGVPMLNLFLNIKDANRYYVIKIKDCMKVGRGWILTQGPELEGISKLKKN